MLIKNRLRINSAGIAVLVLATVSVIWLTIVRVQRVLEASKVADAIFISSYERLVLRIDSTRYGSERTKLQLIAKHKEVGDLLQVALRKFPDPEDQKTLRDLIAKNFSIGYLSRTIRQNREKIGAAALGDRQFQETEAVLMSQLNSKVYESVLLQGKLQESSTRAVTSALRLAAAEILLVLLAVSSVVLVNSVFINRLFASRIAILRDGTAVIGGGDLDHLIDAGGNDELSELAESFNRMTGKLRSSYRELRKEIEERRHAEEALGQSEERFRLAQELSPDGFCILRPYRDPAGRVVDFTWVFENSALARLNGTDQYAVVGRRLLEVLPSHADSPFHKLYQQVAESGQTRVTEAPFRGETMTEQKWFRVAVVPSGPDIAILAQDITAQKQAEETLRQSEEKFSLAFANNPAALALTRLEDGVVLDVNDTWLALCGFKREEIIGVSARGLGMWPTPEDAERFVEHLKKEGAVRGWEQPFRRISGEMFLTQYWAQLLTVQGEPVILSTLIDITEAKRAEEGIKASLHEKEVLLREIHHRVKNNLQVISSLMSLQAAGSGDGTIRQVLDEVSSRVRSMALVHEKLYQSADLAHIDFADYLQSLLSYIWRAHGSAAAGIRLALELEPVALPVDTAVPCGLIMNELAGNALKHAFPRGAGGEVAVSLKQEGDTVRFSVADNGVGMPEGLDWRKVSSLGLRLVQMLAGQLKATVSARTDRGTWFEIVFRLPS